MKILLDTHALLWSIEGEKLSQTAIELFLDKENELYFSVASYWEICIKTSLGKLKLSASWRKIIDDEMSANNIKWLEIGTHHCEGVTELPFVHADPFDRLLISQANLENMALLSADQNIHQYEVNAIW